MATSALGDIGQCVTLHKDIQIRDFERNATPNSGVFYHNESEPFCKVFVNPVCRNNPEFVSVRVTPYTFFPRFFPGVVYRTLGWNASVLDDEGEKKFETYFGYEDFQSMGWVEDFFSDRGYEMEEFVERSVLLDDPERFLPRGVLTVRVEMFYECRVGDEALETRGEELQAYIVKPFLPFFARKQGCVKPDFRTDEVTNNVASTAEGQKSMERLFQEICLEDEREDFYKRECVLMMEETFQELNEVFELYAKCQQHEQYAELSRRNFDSIGENFCQDFTLDKDLFQTLFSEVGLVGNVLSWNEKPFDEQEIISQQILRTVAINKFLKMHWKRCKEEYKSAAQAQISKDDDTMKEGHRCEVGEGIRELFFIYKEVGECQEELLIYVSRFLKVFSNVLRLLSLRLFWPVCVSSIERHHQSRATEDKFTRHRGLKTSKTLMRITSEGQSINEATSSTNMSDEAPSEIWYFIIETSDQKRFQIPFQTGKSTLGSLLSASPVFDRMLETPMAEKSNRFLKIDEFDSSTFSRFLSYVESGGRVDVDSLQECLDLYQLAHKYQVDKLVLDCAEKFKHLMVHDFMGVEQFAEFSKFYGDDTLMTTVEYFRFLPRAMFAFWGLADDLLDLLSPDTTWARTIKDEPVFDKLKEGTVVQIQKEKYDFYE